jgi:hypothetical protein
MHWDGHFALRESMGTTASPESCLLWLKGRSKNRGTKREKPGCTVRAFFLELS